MGKTSFTYKPILGGYEKGVTRRDPSPVIKVDDTYHIWYSRTTVSAHGYTASVWHATSHDGHAWTEDKEAVPKGSRGAYDEQGVFTPTVLVAEGKFFLAYTAAPSPFDQGGVGATAVGTKTAIGMASSESPYGPWTKYESNPILTPSANSDDFDSYRTDDACFVVRGGEYRLYYKGRQMFKSPGETKAGIAIADHPLRPYVKYKGNPVIGSGHEVCVFPKGSCVMSIVSPTGPDGRTIQYSEDGLHFEVIERDIDPPSAPGSFREDNFRDGIGPGIKWGVCQNVRAKPEWPFLERFDVKGLSA